MSHLSRNRTRLIAGAVIATAGTMSSVSSALPLVNVVMLGTNLSTGGTAYTSSVAVSAGDTVMYEVLSYLSPLGTTNAHGLTINTASPTTDGVNSLSFDAFEVVADQIQVDMKYSIVSTTDPSANSAMSLFTGPGGNANTGTQKWGSGTGANGGKLGHPIASVASPGTARSGSNNDVVFIRPVLAAGTFRGISSTQAAAQLGTGLFTVFSLGSGASTLLKMKYEPTSSNGGVGAGGGIQFNNGATTVTLTDSSERATDAAVDPYATYVGLTLTTGVVPEPGCFSLLGLAAAGLVARRKNKA